MFIPTIKGIIDRRILINFTADPEVVRKIVPAPFSPKIYQGKAIVGICLIRLKNIRPKGIPPFLGVSSENGAHRIAVEWTENGEVKEGVFIPRRDSSSFFNHMVGGRFFPGQHHQAKFNVKEDGGQYQVAFKSEDGTTISINAEKTDVFNPASIFKNIGNASNFFEGGATGYSPGNNGYDGLELRTSNWKVEPLRVKSVQSSFFDNRSVFPENTVEFDNALLMTELEHEWHSAKKKSKCV